MDDTQQKADEQTHAASDTLKATTGNHDVNDKDRDDHNTREAPGQSETKRRGKYKPQMTPWTTAEWYDHLYTYYQFANKSRSLPSIRWYFGEHLNMPERVRSFCRMWKEVGLQQHLLREKHPRSKEVQECLNNFLKSRTEHQQKKMEAKLDREKKRQQKAQEQIRQLKQNRKQKASAPSTSPRKRARMTLPEETTRTTPTTTPPAHSIAYHHPHHAPVVVPSPLLMGRQREEMEAIERAMQRHCQLRIERRFYEIFGSYRNHRGEPPGRAELLQMQQCIEENMAHFRP